MWAPDRAEGDRALPKIVAARKKSLASLMGIVVDKEGNPLSSATLVLMDSKREFVAEAVTNEQGEYRFDPVPAGEGYKLRVSMPGYQTLEFEKVRMDAGRKVVQHVTLRPSGKGPFPEESPAPWFDAVLIRPRDFRPERRYPVILSVYGGPGYKMVRALPRFYLREQWMADHGYIVVSLDGRGTPGHGREWERAIKGNLIDAALEDQVAGLRALGEKYPELDLTRVGITGWSFGGYFTAMATVRRGDVFRCGVAGAPVTDWLDYDTHYTERYMDLPSANPEGYRKASVLTYASELRPPPAADPWADRRQRLRRAHSQAGRRALPGRQAVRSAAADGDAPDHGSRADPAPLFAHHGLLQRAHGRAAARRCAGAGFRESGFRPPLTGGLS